MNLVYSSDGHACGLAGLINLAVRRMSIFLIFNSLDSLKLYTPPIDLRFRILDFRIIRIWDFRFFFKIFDLFLI